MNNSTPLSSFEIFELSIDLSIAFDHMVEATRKPAAVVFLSEHQASLEKNLSVEWVEAGELIFDEVCFLSKEATPNFLLLLPEWEVVTDREGLDHSWFSTYGEEKEHKETETLVSPRIPARRFYRRANPCSLFY